MMRSWKKHLERAARRLETRTRLFALDAEALDALDVIIDVATHYEPHTVPRYYYKLPQQLRKEFER